MIYMILMILMILMIIAKPDKNFYPFAEGLLKRCKHRPNKEIKSEKSYKSYKSWAKTTAEGGPSASYKRFSIIFRYSTFMGGPTCTCTPSSPFDLPFTGSLSVTSLISTSLI